MSCDLVTSVVTDVSRSSPTLPGVTPRAAVVELRNVVRRYGSFTALDDIRLTIECGEAVALVGPNGAGKTTTIECLLGLAPPQAGSVRLLGEPPRLSRHARAVGVVLADSGFPPTAPVGALLDALGRMRGVETAPMAERFDLTSLARARFESLSLGQRQRVRLAIALAGTPDLIIADEPSTALDLEARSTLVSVLKEHRSRGGALLLATHDLAEASALADRVIVLSQGHIVADATPREIRGRSGVARVSAVLRERPDARLLDRYGAATLGTEGDRTTFTATDPDGLAHGLLHLGASALEITPVELDEAIRRLLHRRPDPTTEEHA